jgi:uncharacterized membrane protein
MRTRNETFSRALGWVSLALGVLQLAAPRTVGRLSGVDDPRVAKRASRLVGARELMHAAVLLGSRRPGPWAWSRVAGDALDLAMLGRALSNRPAGRRRRITAATAAVAAITAADLFAAIHGTRSGGIDGLGGGAGAGSGTGRRRGRRVGKIISKGRTRLHASIVVNRPRDEVYAFWRDFENLPAFMIHLESVRDIGERRSRWTAKGPVTDVEWEAEIVDERVGELIAWGSVRGSAITTSGVVGFADGPGGLGTVVDVTMEYGMPGGALGAALARLLGEHPEQQIRDDLRRFKQVMETGEVLRSDGSPEGTRALRMARQRPAQPVGGRP